MLVSNLRMMNYGCVYIYKIKDKLSVHHAFNKSTRDKIHGSFITHIDGGTVFHRPVLNIDLTPTFLDIANVDIPNHMDGKSFLPTVLSEKKL